MLNDESGTLIHSFAVMSGCPPLGSTVTSVLLTVISSTKTSRSSTSSSLIDGPASLDNELTCFWFHSGL